MAILPLETMIMYYPWGSHEALASLQGRTVPSPLPEAELWMGAHPKATSRVRGRSLRKIIASDPVGVLGRESVASHGERLPYLFKLLAAAEPLSIQAHPDREQARAGYARENDHEIGFDDPARCYRDDNHKPEVVYALSEFWALNGFRPVDEILELIDHAGLDAIAAEASALKATARLEDFFPAVMRLDAERRASLTGQLMAAASGMFCGRPEGRWLHRINSVFPGDPGLLSVLMLNLVRLEPGQIMASQAGTLHAYLGGFCVELMANSDNVLRGGLTTKYIDLDELTRILSFAPHTPEIRTLGDEAYDSPSGEFRLEVIRVNDNWTAPALHGCDIIVVTSGSGTVTDHLDHESFFLESGEACVITASTGSYELAGAMTIARASVPDSAGSS